jgi:hypothetical protein
MFPHAQKNPHRSFNQEVDLLKKYFPDGSPYIMGPLDGDHWYIFIVDRIDRPGAEETYQYLTMYMFDIDPVAARLFTKQQHNLDAKEVAAFMFVDSSLRCPNSPAWPLSSMEQLSKTSSLSPVGTP